MSDLTEMWTALERYQPYADKAGHGDSWRQMTTERTAGAAWTVVMEMWAKPGRSTAALRSTVAASNAAWAAHDAVRLAEWAAEDAAAGDVEKAAACAAKAERYAAEVIKEITGAMEVQP